ncbi:MAG: hydroxymethylbilane synthase [Candidatus Bathyarchaeia archaeon]
MKLTVGTRGSVLALKHVEIVAAKLKEGFPSLELEIKIIKTAGDKFRESPLAEIKEKGIFSKAVDRAVLEGRVSFAIHSMKDLPTELPEGVAITAVPERTSPHDVLVSTKYAGLNDLPKGAVVGTSSPRRKAQALHVRGDLTVRPIRGNVDTRLRKLEEGVYDALILAEAGLLRLNREDAITERLPLMGFTPSAGQGALAVVSQEGDEEVNSVLRRITHPPSMAAVEAERAFVNACGGGCKVPLGVIARSKEKMEIYATLLSPDGRIRLQYHSVGDSGTPGAFGRASALEMLAQGGAGLIERWR